MEDSPDSVRGSRNELQIGSRCRKCAEVGIENKADIFFMRAVIWATPVHISEALGYVPARPKRGGGGEGRGSAAELFGSFPPASEREARMDDPMIWSRLGRIRNVVYERSRTQAGALSLFLANRRHVLFFGSAATRGGFAPTCTRLSAFCKNMIPKALRPRSGPELSRPSARPSTVKTLAFIAILDSGYRGCHQDICIRKR